MLQTAGFVQGYRGAVDSMLNVNRGAVFRHRDASFD